MEIPDESLEEESVIEVIEPTDEEPLLSSSTIPDFIEEPIDEEIIFLAIEDAPVFPGCENAKNKKACFQEQMQQHIRRNFNYPEAAIDMNLQGRVNLKFTIDKDGSITNVLLRGPHKILENEASRIISKLPTMQPGKQRGQPVKVSFALPINFKLR